jgi:hypothetical protein
VNPLAHPFRFGSNGRAVTVEEGSELATAQGIAVAALTTKGERTLVPTFGVTSPVFGELDVAELNAHLGTFGPPVQVTSAEVDYPEPTTARVVLAYDDGAP